MDNQVTTGGLKFVPYTTLSLAVNSVLQKGDWNASEFQPDLILFVSGRYGPCVTRTRQEASRGLLL